MENLDSDDVETDTNVRTYYDIVKEKQNVDYETATTREQKQLETNVLKIYKNVYKLEKEPLLLKYEHIHFLKKSLTCLSRHHEALDSSRPWLCYWILHSLHMLNVTLEEEEYSKIVLFLSKCQDPEGGFGGGPGQFPHLASTYAAINVLCTIGTKEAYNLINRQGLYRFIKSLRNSDGSFCMHHTGEVDLRGVYCALVVAKLTNIYTSDMFKDTEKWIVKCQTYEGGFGGCPGMEAHGGYAYCGIASLVLLGKTDIFNLPAFMRWIVNRQMRLEGGFQGRTNKLVDGCYSFWQGAAYVLMQTLLAKGTDVIVDQWMFDQTALQEYLLFCCQHSNGGFLDKPDRNYDIYHTCYGLSGLSIAQNSVEPTIIGPSLTNSVHTIHPIYNLVLTSAIDSVNYFATLSIPE